MTIQEYMIDSTKRSAAETFRYAKVVPADKWEWAPLDSGRTVLDMCREITMTPKWAVDIINGVPMEWNEESMAATKAEQAQWNTPEECETEFNVRIAKLEALYLSLTDEKLKETRWLPFDGGRDFTFLEMMEYPRWNLNYHLGQIAYIQTLYGDKEMH